MPNFPMVYYNATIHELIEDEKREEEQRKMRYERLKCKCTRNCDECTLKGCPELNGK